MTRPARDAWDGADTILDESACPVCLRESCEGPGDPHCRPAEAPPLPKDAGLDPAALSDAVDVANEGREIQRVGVRYLVQDLIPGYGMLGFTVAYTKVGKTTLGHACGAAVAMHREFLGRQTQQCRVLCIAAEDPKEYTAYVARHLDVAPGVMTFYRAPLVLNNEGLGNICAEVRTNRYGFVLISSWQACVRGLIRDENDNAGAVLVTESVKAAARETGIPWLIDAHSGKGEDHSDDADPTKALRGASAAAGAADFLLSLRYAGSPFSTKRRLSGKGRFVSFAPLTLDFDPATSTYTCLGSAGAKDVHHETLWQMIREAGTLNGTPRSLTEIARACGLIRADDRLDGGKRKQLRDVLSGRPEVGRVDGLRQGKKTDLYRLLDGVE